MEHAVDAEADDERVLLRLEVDVGGPVLGRLEDHGVDEPDERRIGDPVVDLEVVALFLLLDLEVLLDRRARTERLRRANESADLGLDVLAPADADLDRIPRREPELVDRVHVRRIGNRDPERPVLERVRNRGDPLEHVERHLPGGVVVDAG